ncbi:MAG: hypothetical protein LLG00_15720 [Planctomycetaceae bacterium]|nr:hypothetical protein [Planctomycetaceae bacterium]
METIKGILRQYWLHLGALAVLICAGLRYWRLGNYLEINRLRLMIFAFAGFVAVVASDEFSDWTGHYGFTRAQWFATPSCHVRIVGAMTLVYSTVALFSQ